MSVQQQPEVLLKRSPVVRDVTTAHIALTNKLSASETSSKVPPPLPSARSDISKSDASSSGYKLLSSIPGAGRKVVSQENKSTSTSSIEAKSGYKLLSSIPGAGKNVSKENKSTSCGESVVLSSASATVSAATATKPSNEKLTAPLTIIVPNISRAFARPNR